MSKRKKEWKALEDAFHKLTALSLEDQVLFLDGILEEDPDLYHLLASLLDADREAHPIFNVSAPSLFNVLESDQDLIGSSIGSFELEELVGQGAMGSVFKAKRIDGQFDQIVAIKLMKPVVLNSSFREFFQRERQILAKLNHPHIARLYDGGFTADERPYFTMEWVSGKNLIEHSNAEKLGLNNRIDLFLQVCQAVKYAHQSLIAHLDLKPQNIIVHEGDQVKLLDFGVSKMMEEGEDQSSSFTLAYASPEQIQKTNVGTNSDLYALGVIFQELLSGKHPFNNFFDDRQNLKDAILKVVSLPFSLSSDFGNVPFAEDLEMICSKAMQINPEDRYGSVDEMTRDIKAFLNNYPVLAEKTTWSYKSKKYFRRNRAMLSSLGGAFLLLSAMGVYYTVQLAEQRNIAQEEAKRANQITDLMSDVFLAADPNVGGADTITAVQLLNKGLEDLEKNTGENPELYADMLARLSPIFFNLGQYDKGMETAEKAYEINSSLSNTNPEITAERLTQLSSGYYYYGNIDTSLVLVNQSVQLLKENGLGNSEMMAITLYQKGNSLYDLGRNAEADSSYRAAYDIYLTYFDPPNLDLATSLHMIGANLIDMGELDEAEKYLMDALNMKKQLFQEPHLEIAYTYNYLGTLNQKKGEDSIALGYVQESLRQRRTILGDYHVETVASMGNTARTLIRLGKAEEAIPIYEKALVIIDSLMGESHYYFGALSGSLANAYFSLKDYPSAKKYYLKAAENFQVTMDANNPRQASPYVNLGKVEEAEGNYEKALTYYKKGLEIRESIYSEGHLDIAQSQQTVGECLLAMGDYPIAIEYLEKARDAYQEDKESNKEAILSLNSSLASAYQATDNKEKAEYYRGLASNE
jgi:serine/threonine-protein kinase